MRTIVVAAALLAGTLFAASLQACEKCDTYFSYQSLTWCDYCAASYCGYYTCRIQYYPGLGSDYCTGDDGCFEVGHGCRQERELQETRLESRWRLARVQVMPPHGLARPQDGRRHIVARRG